MVWQIQNSSLLKILDTAWEDLEPDSDSFLDNLKKLLDVAGAELPYKLDHTAQLYQADFIDAEPDKFKANDKIKCHICDKDVELKVMRQHVGKHILQACRYKENAKGVEKVSYKLFKFLFYSTL